MARHVAADTRGPPPQGACNHLWSCRRYGGEETLVPRNNHVILGAGWWERVPQPHRDTLPEGRQEDRTPIETYTHLAPGFRRHPSHR